MSADGKAKTAWRVTGQMYEVCSCKMLCPCWLGPAEPDQGWCSGLLIWNVQQGDSDGVNLDGCKVVGAVEWPGDFWSGNGTARLYIDESADADQRRELEGIFGGQGGPHAPVWEALFTTLLPSEFTKIEIHDGDTPSVTVGGVGEVHYQPLRDEQTGQQATVRGAAAANALHCGDLALARSDGSRFSGPDMRAWESGGSGVQTTFSWSS